jgi:WD40 repeat protein
MAGPGDARREENFVLSKMRLSADGRRLAVSYTYAENFVRVWNVAEGIDITPYCLKGLVDTNRERGCQVSNTASVALSIDGGLLAVSDAGVTQLFDLSKDREAPPLTVLTKVSVASLAFSPDRRYFGVGSYNGLLYVLDSQFGWAQAARLAHDGAIRAVTFTGDGSYVATVSDNPGDPNHSLGSGFCNPTSSWPRPTRVSTHCTSLAASSAARSEDWTGDLSLRSAGSRRQQESGREKRPDDKRPSKRLHRVAARQARLAAACEPQRLGRLDS